MYERLNRFAPLLARILLSAIFLVSAALKLIYWNGSVQGLEAKHLPVAPLLLAAAVTLELAGGLALITGLFSRPAALLLLLYLIPTTLLFHNFWAFSGPEQPGQMINFLKNLAIMGGLLLLAANGPGPLGLRLPKAAPHE